MAPPGPPRAVEKRRTASWLHSMQPTRLTSITRRSVARSSPTKRVMRPVVPALLTSAVTGPERRGDRVEQPRDVLGLGDVGLDRERPAARGADALDHGLRGGARPAGS